MQNASNVINQTQDAEVAMWDVAFNGWTRRRALTNSNEADNGDSELMSELVY